MSHDGIIHGGCHCGALGYTLRWPLRDESGDTLSIVGRQCSCSFCTRIDGAWTSHPQAQLTVSENAANPATRYRFGTKTADFLFCSQCGIAPIVTCELDRRTFAVVNVNTFDADRKTQLELSSTGTCFDGETLDERLARRKQRWIASVTWKTA